MADRPSLPPAEQGLTADNTLMTEVTGFYRKFVALSQLILNRVFYTRSFNEHFIVVMVTLDSHLAEFTLSIHFGRICSQNQKIGRCTKY